MNAKAATGLIVLVLVCFGVAWGGSLLVRPALPGWYAGLSKPAWTPPSWLFGPVWTALYLMMATAAWLVWRRAGWPAAAWPLALFGVQLVLNGAWTPIFFGLQEPGWAFAEIVALWAAIVTTLVAFWRVAPVAGWLMVPYLAWTTFAAVLNFAIWRMN